MQATVAGGIIEASGRPFNSSAPIVFDQPD